MVTDQIDTCVWLQKHNTVYITFRREGINENPNSCKYIALKLKSVKNASRLAITDLNVPNGSRDIISQSQDFGQDGHCQFVGFQPHFHLNMTSQTQCCKTIKNLIAMFQKFFV